MKIATLRKCGLVSYIIVSSTFTSAWAQCIETNRFDNWRNMIEFNPKKADLSEHKFQQPNYEIQTLNDSENLGLTNLDEFRVHISQLPNKFKNHKSFFDHFRRSINSFLEADIATVRGISDDNTSAWIRPGAAPVGGVYVFDIHDAGWGVIHEQAAVIVSESSSTHWIFSTIKMGQFAPGAHPVSGHREFGIETVEGGGFDIYVKGVDRVRKLWLVEKPVANPDVVLSGGDALWKSFQDKVTSYINKNGGIAKSIPPITNRLDWIDVTKNESATNYLDRYLRPVRYKEYAKTMDNCPVSISNWQQHYSLANVSETECNRCIDRPVAVAKGYMEEMRRLDCLFDATMNQLEALAPVSVLTGNEKARKREQEEARELISSKYRTNLAGLRENLKKISMCLSNEGQISNWWRTRGIGIFNEASRIYKIDR